MLQMSQVAVVSVTVAFVLLLVEPVKGEGHIVLVSDTSETVLELAIHAGDECDECHSGPSGNAHTFFGEQDLLTAGAAFASVNIAAVLACDGSKDCYECAEKAGAPQPSENFAEECHFDFWHQECDDYHEDCDGGVSEEVLALRDDPGALAATIQDAGTNVVFNEKRQAVQVLCGTKLVAHVSVAPEVARGIARALDK